MIEIMSELEKQEEELIVYLCKICPNNNDRLDIGDGITIYRMEKGKANDCWQFSAYGMNTYIHVKEKANKLESIGFHRRLLGLSQAAEIKRLRDALEGIAASSYSHAQHARRCAENALKPQESEDQNG